MVRDAVARDAGQVGISLSPLSLSLSDKLGPPWWCGREKRENERERGWESGRES